MYFVEVSLVSGNAESFDVCISTTQEFIECSYGEIDINRIENPGANPSGPFCPGETVEICYELTFNVDLITEGNGCQYLQGVVPVFGGGWDMAVSNPQSQPLDDNWEWFDDVTYNVDSPVLGLSTDSNNNTILEFGTGGLGVGDLIPGGWWITSPAPPSSGCVTDGHPNNSWGMQWPCGQSVTINHCFMMTAKSPQNISDCDDTFQTDLGISLFTFADGETGCWEGKLACAGDTPITFEGKIDCSALVEYDLGNDEICSGDFASVPVGIVGDYEIPLSVEVLDPGNTTGAKDHIFMTGSGLIPDQIVNNGSSIETITYQVSFHEPQTDCITPVETFEVLVHPEFVIPSYAPIELCEGDTEEVIAPSGHDGYEWYDAVKDSLLSTDEQYEISEAGFYRLEVTEGFCTAKEIIEVTTVEPLPLALNVQEINLCNDDIGTLPTTADLEALQINGVTGTWFNEMGAIINSPDNIDFDGDDAATLVYSFETNSATAPCPDTTYLVEIVIEDCFCPSIEIGQLGDQCAIDNTINLGDLEISMEPGQWLVEDGPDVSSINILGDQLIISTNAAPGQYTLSFTIDAVVGTCPRTSEIMFEIFEQPILEIVPAGVACNEFNGSDPESIDLDMFNINGVSGFWSTTETQVSIDGDNVVDFSGADIKEYIFTFTTDFAPVPCENPMASTTINVRDCSCPSVGLSPLDDQCLGDITIDLSTIKLTSETGSWELTNGPDISSIGISGDMMQISSSTVPGDYTLQFNLEFPSSEPQCEASSSVEFSIFETPSALIIPNGDVCNEDTGIGLDYIDLDDFNMDNASGLWTTSEASVSIDGDNQVDFRGADIRDYVFTFTTNTAQDPCLDVEYTTTITVNDCTCPSVEISSLDNQCLEEQSFDLNTLKITTEDGDWSIADGPDVGSLELIGSQLRLLENTIPGLYTIRFTLSDLPAGSTCDPYSEFDFELVAKPVADITPQAVACNEFNGSDPESIDLDMFNINGVSGIWSTDETEVSIDSDNVVGFSGVDIKEYVFTFTTDFATAPCENVMASTTINVRDCTCPSVGLNPIDNQCLDDITIDLTTIKLTSETGSWELTGGPDVSSISLSGDVMEISNSTIPGDYTLQFNLEFPSAEPNCEPSSSIEFSIFETPSASITPNGEVCNEDTGIGLDYVDLSEYNPSNASGVWSTLETNVTIDGSNQVDFRGAPIGDYVFTFTTNTAQDPCQDVEYTTTITVNDCSCPSIEILSLDNQCLEEQVFDLNTLKITTEDGGLVNYEWS